MFTKLYNHFKKEYPNRYEKGVAEDEAFINKFFKGWDKNVKPEKMGSVLDKYMEKASNLGGQEALGHLGISAEFSMKDQATLDAIGIHADKIAREIGDATQADLQRALRKMYTKVGMSPYEAEGFIKKMFKEKYKNRARTIARTETGIAQATASHQTYVENKVTHKQWRAMLVNTRKTHQQANGQKKRINEPFLVGGSALMHPLDPGGDPAEIINCRCVERPIVTSEQTYDDATGLDQNGNPPWTGGGVPSLPPRLPRMDRQFSQTYGKNGARNKAKTKTKQYADPDGVHISELTKMSAKDNAKFQAFIDARQYDRAMQLLHRYEGQKVGFMNSIEKSQLKQARKAYAKCKGFKA